MPSSVPRAKPASAYPTAHPQAGSTPPIDPFLSSPSPKLLAAQESQASNTFMKLLRALITVQVGVISSQAADLPAPFSRPSTRPRLRTGSRE